jgi:hypothetical protein
LTRASGPKPRRKHSPSSPLRPPPGRGRHCRVWCRATAQAGGLPDRVADPPIFCDALARGRRRPSGRPNRAVMDGHLRRVLLCVRQAGRATSRTGGSYRPGSRSGRAGDRDRGEALALVRAAGLTTPPSRQVNRLPGADRRTKGTVHSKKEQELGGACEQKGYQTSELQLISDLILYGREWDCTQARQRVACWSAGRVSWGHPGRQSWCGSRGTPLRSVGAGCTIGADGPHG